MMKSNPQASESNTLTSTSGRSDNSVERELAQTVSGLVDFSEKMNQDTKKMQDDIKKQGRLISGIETITILGFILIIITVAGFLVVILHEDTAQSREQTRLLQEIKDKVNN